MFEAELTAIDEAILSKQQKNKRLTIAIAGPPASGKSSIAEALVEHLGNQSVLVPMDGFHLDNRILEERDLLFRKGAPETFDAEGFRCLVQRIALEEESVAFPIFDRQRDLSIAAAGVVSAKHSIVVFEGNYLLLDQEPWNLAKANYDLTIALNTDVEILEQRLIQRWLDHGLSPLAAEKRAKENDLINARFIQDKSLSADLVI